MSKFIKFLIKGSYEKKGLFWIGFFNAGTLCFSFTLAAGFISSFKVYAQSRAQATIHNIQLLNNSSVTNKKYKQGDKITIRVTFNTRVCVPVRNRTGVYLNFFIGTNQNQRRADLVFPVSTNYDNGVLSLDFIYTVKNTDQHGDIRVSASTSTPPSDLFGCSGCGQTEEINTGDYYDPPQTPPNNENRVYGDCEFPSVGVDNRRALNKITNFRGAQADGEVPEPQSVSFSSLSPAGTYKIGDKIDFVVTFSESIRLGTGKPALYLKLGTASNSPVVTAYYKAGSIRGTNDKTADFTFTVAEGHDLLGAGDSVFSLGSPPLFIGYSLVDQFGNPAKNNSANFSFNGSTNGYKVDGIRPQVRRIRFAGSPNGGTPTDGTYLRGDKIYVEMEFDDEVKITGVPALALQMGRSIKWASYDSAQSRRDPANKNSLRFLTFSYTVGSGDSDTTGISIPQHVLTFPSRSSIIKDAADNDVNIVQCPQSYRATACLQVSQDLAITNHPGHKVNGSRQSQNPGGNPGDNEGPYPTTISVDSVTSPPETYRIGDKIDFIVTFSENIRLGVVGRPTLHLKLGTASHAPQITAYYKKDSISGRSDRDAVFTYTVSEGDMLHVADGGLSLFDPPLNIGSSVEDLDGNLAKNSDQTLTLVGGTGYIVDGIRPQVSGVRFIGYPNGGSPRKGTYLRQDMIYVEVSFNEDVVVTGIPKLALDIGGSIKWADYDPTQSVRTPSGSLIFSYNVRSQDSDSDGIRIPRNDMLKLPSGSSIKDITGNTASAKSCPAKKGYSDGILCVTPGNKASFPHNDIVYKVDGSKRSKYPQGRSESEIFDVRVRTPNPNNPGYGDNPYRTGSEIIVDVTFLNDGIEIANNNLVYIPVVIDGGESGAKTVNFVYSQQRDRLSTDNRLTFVYRVAGSDIDKDGFELEDGARVHGSVRYKGQEVLNEFELGLNDLSLSPGTHDNFRINYFPAPYGSLISQVKLITPASYGNDITPYQEGHTIVIEVTFNEAVYVPSNSKPYINLEIGPNADPALKRAYYSPILDKNNRDNKLVFSYTLTASDMDTDGFALERGGRIYGIVKSEQTRRNLTAAEMSYPSLVYSNNDNLQINPSVPQFDFEDPGFGSVKSGIGLFSGWACPNLNVKTSNAQSATVEIKLNDSTVKIPVPYGSIRDDTVDRCNGHANNGFVAVYNFDNLGPGDHSATLYVNGVETGKKQRFHVLTTTENGEWLSGESGSGVVYLSNDMIAHLVWDEPKQGVSIAGFDEEVEPISPLNEKSSSSAKGFLEYPVDGSTQTGIGHIHGWVCEAGKKSGTPGYVDRDGRPVIPGQSTLEVTMEVSDSDGEVVFGPVKVPYGSSRPDTKKVCGDNNNGFAMIMDWNALLSESDGNGQARYGPEIFTVDLYVNKKWKDSAQIQVISQGEEFVEGVRGNGYVYLDQTGLILKVVWDEATQNFRIVEMLYE